MMQSRDAATSEYLRYALPFDESTKLLKPNGFLSGYTYQAQSFLGRPWDYHASVAQQLAASIAGLDNQWGLWIEMMRRPGGFYPTEGAWPEKGLYYLDAVRRARCEQDGIHYVNQGRLWLACYPRRPRTSWWADLTGKSADFFQEPHSRFVKKRGTLEAAFGSRFVSFERMDLRLSDVVPGLVVDPMIRALRECMLGESGEIGGDTEEPIFVDGVVAEPIEKGDVLRVGGKFVTVHSIWGYPRFVFPAMLKGLSAVEIGTLRYGMRIVPLSLPQAEGAMDAQSRIHALSGLGPQLFSPGGAQEDETASSWRRDCKDGKGEAKSGVPFALCYTYVVTYSDSEAESAEVDEAVSNALTAARVVHRREIHPNTFDAFLATLPGEIDRNEVRVGRLSVPGALKMAPITSTYQGPEYHPNSRYGRRARELFTMTTRTREILRFFHHVGEVGHMLYIGPTGTGKSYMLRTIESAHLAAYERARVLSLDIGYSAFKLPYFVGGSHFVADTTSGPQIAFLAGLNDPAQFETALDVLIESSAGWLNAPLTSYQLRDVRNACEILAEKEPCLSDLGLACQDQGLQDLYRRFKGSFLDAREDKFSFRSPIPYWVFEYGGLGRGNNRWTTPFFLHVQRRFFSFLDTEPNAPTLVVMDEAGSGMKVSSAVGFAETVEREGRKNIVSFVFACQSTQEVLESSISDVLITQTKTKVCGSIPEARSPIVRKQLQGVGFSDDAIEEIGGLDQHEVLIENEYGTQVARLLPTPVELALCGNASNDDRDVVRELIDRYGSVNWVEPYLERYGPEMVPYLNAYRALGAGRLVS